MRGRKPVPCQQLRNSMANQICVRNDVEHAVQLSERCNVRKLLPSLNGSEWRDEDLSTPEPFDERSSSEMSPRVRDGTRAPRAI